MTRSVQKVRERLEYQNSYVQVYDDDVEFRGGSLGRYLRIVQQAEGSGVVLIARHKESYALVRTYRYPIGAYQWAFPRGFSHGPDLEQTARMELREELGVEVRDQSVLGYLTPDSGLLAARVAVVLAEVDAESTTPEDTQEVEAIEWVDGIELRDRLRTGAIEDGFTLAAWALLTLKG
jgi:8-oxo-dGTP pyrophosphatase MutT (NUDIX family)